MDKRKCGSVRRCDFFESTTEHVTLDMRRTLTRGDLHERFRSSAAEMTLEELLRRVWPTSTDADRQVMNGWAKLRDASSVLSDKKFQGTRQDLKRIFDLLDVDGSQTLSMNELTRARILTKTESQKLLTNWYAAFNSAHDSSCDSGKKEGPNLTFNEFCLMTQKHLADKYAHKDDGSDNWEKHCRSAFRASRATTVSFMSNAAPEGESQESQRSESPYERTSPRKVSLKTAGSGVKAANLFNRPSRIVMAC
jgi:Ca2+-binding EF-hand superfamily protein